MVVRKAETALSKRDGKQGVNVAFQQVVAWVWSGIFLMSFLVPDATGFMSTPFFGALSTVMLVATFVVPFEKSWAKHADLTRRHRLDEEGRYLLFVVARFVTASLFFWVVGTVLVALLG